MFKLCFIFILNQYKKLYIESILVKFLVIIITTINFCIYSNVFVNFYGNIGNQMFQYAVGYAIAQEKKVDLILTKNTLNNSYNLSHKNNSLLCSPRFYFSELDSNGYVTDSQKFKPELFLVNDNTAISGYFQTDKYFIKHRTDLINIFTFKDRTIEQKIKLLSKDIKKKIACMHIRASDYFTNGFPVMDYDYYIKAIKMTLTLLNASLDEFFFMIISDDTDGEYVKKITAKIKAAFNGINIDWYKQNNELEFTLMKQADVCITSASSFSWWAAWLNKRCKIIISPKYWFNYYKTGKDVVSEPLDIEMSLNNQHFILSEGFFHNL